MFPGILLFVGIDEQDAAE